MDKLFAKMPLAFATAQKGRGDRRGDGGLLAGGGAAAPKSATATDVSTGFGAEGSRALEAVLAGRRMAK